ncbi:MAG TPA: hypothetical protein PL110_16670 [Candidatus Eremiobacteraeota bacterium]|nr:MAG: hypothetical protein BWY64_03591 [bacterium ADurb.Bin363]HPZ09735.1 hypothetical protein [Candidatus Eremiobacteraeota bacterium]
MIILAVLAIMTAILIPNIIKSNRTEKLKLSGETRTETPDVRKESTIPDVKRGSGTGQRNECIRNLKDIAKGMEMCFTDRNCYPPGISSIVRLGYVKELKCPFSNKDYIYIASSDRKAFTLCCPGNSAHGSEDGKFQGNYPQYSSSRGIIPAEWNIK